MATKTTAPPEYPMPSAIGVGGRNGWGGPFAWARRPTHPGDRAGKLTLVRVDDLPVAADRAKVVVDRIRFGWDK